MILRNPRVVIPPSKRIHNWKSLPVEGCGRNKAWIKIAITAGCIGLIVRAITLCAPNGLSRYASQAKRAAAIARGMAARKSEAEQLREVIAQAQRVLSDTPELNLNNYDHNDVADLNAGMIEVCAVLARSGNLA